jgi:hypothetical protein
MLGHIQDDPIGMVGMQAGLRSGVDFTDPVIPSDLLFFEEIAVPNQNSFAAKVCEWVQNGRRPSIVRDVTPYPLSC